MTCAEFQKVLPDIIDSGGNAAEEEHLRTCQACSGLVNDLRYIADQARLLVPTMDPSPRVWEGIQSSLEREGWVRPVRGTGRSPAPVVVAPSLWGSAGRFAAFAAVLLIAIGLLTYQGLQKANPGTAASATQTAPVVAALDDDDLLLLQQVTDRAPAVRAAYADSLRSVNAYIADARKAVAQDPADHQARVHLMSACGQKTMLYQMALARSLR